MTSDKLLEESINCITYLKTGLPPCSTANELGHFDFEEFLQTFNVENHSIAEYKVIDRFCKKVDVAKKLRKMYLADLSMSISEQSLNPSYFELFIVYLVYLSVKELDFKFLNTLLKIRSDILPSFSISKDIEKLINLSATILMEQENSH